MITNEKLSMKKNFKLLISFSIPPMISMLIQSLYNIVDSMYVAQYSQDAVTAISYAMPIQNLILAFSVGIGVGVNSYISRKLGENNHEEALKGVFAGFTLAITMALVFIILGILTIPTFFKLFTTDEQILQMCYDYTYIVVFFGLFQLNHILIEKIFQANGKMIFPMLMQGVGAIVNIILDPIFIFNLGMGVKGAAIATIIGQAVAMLMSLMFLFTIKLHFKIDFRKFKLKGYVFKDVCFVGIPSMLLTALTSVLLIVLNAILTEYSQAAVNVYGLYFKLQTFVFMPVSGLTQGSLPIMGYSYGAKNKHNLLMTFKNSLLIGSAIMVAGMILFLSIPGILLGLFNPTEEMLDIGRTTLRIISISFIPATFAMIIPTLFQAMGKGSQSLIVFLLRQLILIVPLVYILSYFLGLNGIWISFIISEGISMIVAYILLRYDYRHDEVLAM